MDVDGIPVANSLPMANHRAIGNFRAPVNWGSMPYEAKTFIAVSRQIAASVASHNRAALSATTSSTG